jgi:hypothetical protein
MEPDLEFQFEAEIWLTSGKGGWHFITLPQDICAAVRMLSGPRSGFGQLPASARIGASRFSTSIFPDTARGSYLLPVKADVRKKERITAGDRVTVSLTINP